METFLTFAQVILGLLVIIGVLLQQSDAGLGSAFGGSGDSGFKQTRRGFDKFLFRFTIVVGVLFALSAFLALIF